MVLFSLSFRVNSCASIPSEWDRNPKIKSSVLREAKSQQIDNLDWICGHIQFSFPPEGNTLCSFPKAFRLAGLWETRAFPASRPHGHPCCSIFGPISEWWVRFPVDDDNNDSNDCRVRTGSQSGVSVWQQTLGG